MRMAAMLAAEGERAVAGALTAGRPR
jgi:hypothetical protein